jgi:hypothetical protein
MSTVWKWVIYICSIVVFGLIGWGVAASKLYTKKIEKIIENVEEKIKRMKGERKERKDIRDGEKVEKEDVDGFELEKIRNGGKIKELLKTLDYDSIKQAEQILKSVKYLYISSLGKRLSLILLFTIIGGILSAYLLVSLISLVKTNYDRSYFDNAIDTMFK